MIKGASAIGGSPQIRARRADIRQMTAPLQVRVCLADRLGKNEMSFRPRRGWLVACAERGRNFFHTGGGNAQIGVCQNPSAKLTIPIYLSFERRRWRAVGNTHAGESRNAMISRPSRADLGSDCRSCGGVTFLVKPPSVSSA
jgi:hypothetical protein